MIWFLVACVVVIGAAARCSALVIGAVRRGTPTRWVLFPILQADLLTAHSMLLFAFVFVEPTASPLWSSHPASFVAWTLAFLLAFLLPGVAMGLTFDVDTPSPTLSGLFLLGAATSLVGSLGALFTVIAGLDCMYAAHIFPSISGEAGAIWVLFVLAPFGIVLSPLTGCAAVLVGRRRQAWHRVIRKWLA